MDWRPINEYIRMKNHFLVINVKSLSVDQLIYRFIQRYIAERSHFPVMNVRKCFQQNSIWELIKECTLVKDLTSVMTVKSLFLGQITLKLIRGHMKVEKSPLPVMNVRKYFQQNITWKLIKGSTQAKNLSNARFAPTDALAATTWCYTIGNVIRRKRYYQEYGRESATRPASRAPRHLPPLLTVYPLLLFRRTSSRRKSPY